ncbi:hypothetical protein [Peribacillus tepidiphilus]|uniref:hypothetical protein n=1 Tax=Peribacillus tepidiphilus TaxID=2652445 RepID=UPI001291A26B|nr:hypothetical protein [Peribacillus tepidiphilus]
MPSISRIRFTNVVYEGGNKRYNDEIFVFDGHNGAILLENGGGKTVFIQTAIQAVLPHVDLADRKVKDTLKLEDAPAHIAIEWILHERPRRYAVTAVSLFLTKNGLDSFRYVYEYGEHDKHSLVEIPFVKEFAGKIRAADRSEIQEYYSYMSQNYLNAKTFDTIKNYKQYLEENYHIIPKEWESIVKINSAEGGVEHFFDECKTTGQLFDRLLIPTVEESLAGFQKHEFAETFEKHRTSFKEYKQLKEKIAENERIKERLDQYVKRFASLDEKTHEYERAKEKAKAYYNLAKNQLNEAEEEQLKLHEALQDWQEKNHLFAQKEASYEIAKEQQKLAEVSIKLTEHMYQRDEIQIQLNETDSFYYSLKLAEMKKNYETEKQRKVFNEEKLKQLDQELDTEEIKEALHENARQIKGYFVELEEKLKNKQQDIQFEWNSVQNTLEEEESNLKTLMTELNELSKLTTSKETIVEQNHKEMKNLLAEALSNPMQETIEEQLPIWIQTTTDLDQENITLIERNKQIKKENEGLKEKLKEKREQLQTAHRKQAEMQSTKNRFEQEHQKLKLKLAERKMIWARVDSVYLKQDSIEKQMLEDIERVSSERERLLNQERLAFRFVDDYATQDVFSADSYMFKQIEQWKSQFTYLETGVSYIHSLGLHLDGITENYSLWPITIVTTNKEKTKLKEKVQHVHEQLQYPIIVLSLDEASNLVQGNHSLIFEWIQPKHWSTNMDPESFAHWKETIQQTAQEARQQRQEKEQELKAWTELQKDWDDFFHHFPFAAYQELTESISKLSDEMFALSSEEKDLYIKLEENEKEFEINEKKRQENSDSINGFETKIEKAQKYLKLKKENEGIEKELVFIRAKIQDFETKASRLKNQIHDLRNQANDLKTEHNQISNQISLTIHENKLYKEVKTVDPFFTETNLEVLEEKRQELKLELEKISKDRGQIETAIQFSNQNMERYEREMDQLRKEKEDLNEELVFPLNGTEKMNELLNKRTKLKSQLKTASEQVEQLTRKHDKLVGSIENMKRKVEKLFEFEGHLEIISQQLNEEKQSLVLRKEHLDRSLMQVEKQVKDIHTAVIEFQKYDTKHKFLHSSVKEALLSSEEIMEFTYARIQITKQMIKQLEDAFDEKEKELKKVENEKMNYIHFCRNEISDGRMQETAIRGIESKHTYEDVLKYKELLEGRIRTAIKYAEQNMITHDQQLEQFIIHVHTHLQKIVDELKLIPKKTSVKIENQWKEIFAFTIPEWDEHAGKAEIRAYIHWILEQLDKDVYKDENGREDVGKMKKDLEKWLQSKQLLQVVMKNQTMKVSCRKVTNDNKVTKSLYSWEQSNVWSGGEKWSKNMTLFLGLLNYIAEKRQHIQSIMKRHRTVIVDNPFGKASSDHVLQPVFFIAEQLGFQIIALTAHAEGKFLRDYFPIIYSCRLRQAEGSEKQIMTKEKIIHHAFFQDNDPQSLEKLAEFEQMELF